MSEKKISSDHFASQRTRLHVDTIFISVISVLICGAIGYKADQFFDTKPIIFIATLFLSFLLTQVAVVVRLKNRIEKLK